MPNGQEKDPIAELKALPRDRQAALLSRMSPEQKTKLSTAIDKRAPAQIKDTPIGRQVEAAKGFGKGALETGRFMFGNLKPQQIPGIPTREVKPAFSSVDTKAANKDQAGGKVIETITELFLSGKAAGADKAVAAVSEKIPKLGRASAAFERLETIAKNVDVDARPSGLIAKEAQKLRPEGMPSIMKDFLTRVDKPGATRLTYSEARKYYSDAAHALQNENLAFSMKQVLYRFKEALGKEIEKGVSLLGPEEVPKYQAALKEYKYASRVEKGLEKLKDLAAKKVIPYYTAYKIAELILGNTAKHLFTP